MLTQHTCIQLRKFAFFFDNQCRVETKIYKIKPIFLTGFGGYNRVNHLFKKICLNYLSTVSFTREEAIGAYAYQNYNYIFVFQEKNTSGNFSRSGAH